MVASGAEEAVGRLRFFLGALAFAMSARVASATVNASTIASLRGARHLQSGIQTKSADKMGYTLWTNTYNTGCLFVDHFLSIDLDVDPSDLSDVSLIVEAVDVDYVDPSKACPAGPEVDTVTVNSKLLPDYLQGANNAKSLSTFPLMPSDLLEGANNINIDTDATGTGCWCVGINYIQIRALVDFNVEALTPQDKDENRAFKRTDVDLTVEFTEEYDTSTLTASSFLLEYKVTATTRQQVAGQFVQESPKKFKFVPNQDLLDGVKYYATVKGGANGVLSKFAGTPLPKDREWTFWTVLNLDDSKAFTDQLGSACAPDSGSCDGLEVDVYQVARDPKLVFGKQAVARVYLRWEKKANVEEQKVELKFDIEMTGAGVLVRKNNQKIKRQDQYNGNMRDQGQNSINVFHTPKSAGSYTVKITPQPQNNAVDVSYTATKAATFAGQAKRITFDQYSVQEAPVPAASEKTFLNELQTGLKRTVEMFPIISATPTSKPKRKLGYTPTGGTVNTGVNDCGIVREVNCPTTGTSIKQREDECIVDRLRTMRNGKRFVMTLVPRSVCPTTGTGFTKAFRWKNVIVFLSGYNENTFPHEIAHEYGISKTADSHRNANAGIEGFQITSANAGNVKSYYDDNGIVSMMHESDEPIGRTWMDNTDYSDLVGQPFTRRLATTGDYLIVSGFVDTESSTVVFTPAFLQSIPNDAAQTSGECSIQLQDGQSGAVLYEDFFDPGDEFEKDSSDGTKTIGRAGTSFSVSLEWDPAATRVVAECENGATGSLEKSANLPEVSILSPGNGTTLTEQTKVTWTGSDGDEGTLAFQPQISVDDGLSWDLLSPLSTDLEIDFDVSEFPNTAAASIRVMVTDGFNVAFDAISVTFQNPLTVRTLYPYNGQSDVLIGSDVRAQFSTHVLPESVSDQTWQLASGGSPVPANVEYDEVTRTATLSPKKALAPSTTFTATLKGIIGTQDESLLLQTWSFTTEGDTIQPSVSASWPVNRESGVPVNTLVQVEFDEEIDQATITQDSFKLLDDDTGLVVPVKSVQYSDMRAVLFPRSDLVEDGSYIVSVSEDVTDLAGNNLISPFESRFTVGDFSSSGARIVGNYNSNPVDNDQDGLYEQLDVLVDVEVLFAGSSNLNGRLLDVDDRLIEWTSTGDKFLSPGYHTLTLSFGSVPIRNSGLDGPYILDSLNFYQGNAIDVGFKVFRTFPYPVTSFFSALNFGPIPDITFKVGEASYPVYDLRELTSHISEPLDSITYEIRINTDTRIGASITNGFLSFNPDDAAIEIRSDITIEARDRLGNRADSRFSVSFELLRAARLEAEYAESMESQSAQTLSFEVFDQFDDLFLEATTIFLMATSGTLSSSSVTTGTGSFEVEFLAGNILGPVFVAATFAGGSEEILLSIDVLEPAPKCMVFGEGTLDLKKDKIVWEITNMEEVDVVTVKTVDVTWPKERQSLEKIKLGGDIFKGSLPPPSATISESEWKDDDPKKRQIKPGKTKKLEMQFSGKVEKPKKDPKISKVVLDDSLFEYFIEVTFAEGCKTSFMVAPPELTAAKTLEIGGKNVKWELSNTGVNPLVISKVDIVWPESNGALREIKLNGWMVKGWAAPSKFSVTEWITDKKRRTLQPGKSKKLEFKFAENADMSDLSRYAIVVEFEEGIGIQYPLGEA